MYSTCVQGYICVAGFAKYPYTALHSSTYSTVLYTVTNCECTHNTETSAASFFLHGLKSRYKYDRLYFHAMGQEIYIICTVNTHDIYIQHLVITFGFEYIYYMYNVRRPQTQTKS